MEAGFITALGTPLDVNGRFLEESFKKQVDDQIKAGAVGLLAMGSMGQQPYIPQGVCPQVAKAALEAAAGRVPVFVGAMDCSIHRAKERLTAMEDLDVAGFVFTTPYYYSCSKEQIKNYYKNVASFTKHSVLMYDLPVVTQSKITYDMVLELIREVPNLKGIKSADQQMFRKLKRNPELPEDFLLIYSGLDTFDIGYKWGLDLCLDGMMSCTPQNSGKLFTCLAAGDYETAGTCLDHILELRDFLVAHDLWAAFSTSMNMLGYEGNFAPDYISPVKEEYIPLIRQELIKIGELTD